MSPPEALEPEAGPPSGRPSQPDFRKPPRPSAPDFQFTPRPPELTEPKASKVRCLNCGAMNAIGVRYCVTCGNGLLGGSIPSPVGAAPTQRPLAVPSGPSAVRAPSPVSVSPAPVASPEIMSRIAPTPVVEIGARAEPAATIRVCARCRGVCDPTAQFCKFCGASLTEPAASANPGGAFPPAQAPAGAARPPTPAAVARQPPPSEKPTRTRGRLIVVAKDGGEGASYPIADQLDVGRVEGNVIIGDDPYLSPRHARVAWKDDTLYLRDLGSMNGIFLRIPQAADAGAGGGVALEVPLKDQDLILMGQQVIRFEVVKDAEEGFGPAVQHGTFLFGTPAAPRYARLCQKTVEGVTRDVFHVRKPETILGRESGDIVFTEDPFLSRRHALIRVDPAKQTFTLSDFGSSNGTFLQIRGEVTLKAGDEFRVGQQLFRVDLGSSTGLDRP